MFDIVNMLKAMFNRGQGIPHGLHQTLDNADVKIKEMRLLKEEAQDDLYTYIPEEGEREFIFEPDFDLDPEGDDDDTN